ncbi:hypothetical protein [Staphylococcus pseudoxylosus]|uniref:hypothetical protein n=1 Tax=Staphylococcus pseudoxylosus TaxID=2282419 RepID=UPI00193A65F4|nr:hypothetical protein [Staphylococcus pseudoxylosus]MBM2659113.1 hypothetical protein [Staphylococcus pseudoxylosus]MCI8278578.1 hypothetical protein [Staphylococcus xylosus]MEB5781818.1 hypothetical protein [Staphylococcus pseudoxylosus]
MSNGAEAIVWKQKSIAKQMIKLEATSPLNAKTYDDLNIKHTRTFNNLIKKEVIIKTGDKYYLDTDAWVKFRKSFQRLFLI